jgi:hypothetical protein
MNKNIIDLLKSPMNFNLIFNKTVLIVETHLF